MLSLLQHWVDQVIDLEIDDLDFISFRLGGSHGKGWADSYSDYDLSLVCSDNLLPIIEKRIIKGNEISFIKDEFYTRLICPQISEQIVLDIHIVNHSKSIDCLVKFAEGTDISNTIQDFLFNLCFSQQLASKGIVPVYSPEFSDKVQAKILHKFIPMFTSHSLDVHYARADFLQQQETLANLSKVLVSVGNALNKQLFRGYKHINKQMNHFSLPIKHALETISTMTSHCSNKDLITLNCKLKDAEIYLYEQLKKLEI